MSALNKFKELINSTADGEILSAAENLLKDMLEIVTTQEQIVQLNSKVKELEEGLIKDNNKVLFFFASDLGDEEIAFAQQTVVGRLRFLKEKADREKLAEEALNPTPKLETEEPTSENEQLV